MRRASAARGAPTRSKARNLSIRASSFPSVKTAAGSAAVGAHRARDRRLGHAGPQHARVLGGARVVLRARAAVARRAAAGSGGGGAAASSGPLATGRARRARAARAPLGDPPPAESHSENGRRFTPNCGRTESSKRSR